MTLPPGASPSSDCEGPRMTSFPLGQEEKKKIAILKYSQGEDAIKVFFLGKRKEKVTIFEICPGENNSLK